MEVFSTCQENLLHCIRALTKRWNPSPTPKRFPEGNLEGLRKSLGRRGWISQFPIAPSIWWSTDILSSSIFLLGVDREGLIVLNQSFPADDERMFNISPQLLTAVLQDFPFLHISYLQGAHKKLSQPNPANMKWEILQWKTRNQA